MIQGEKFHGGLLHCDFLYSAIYIQGKIGQVMHMLVLCIVDVHNSLVYSLYRLFGGQYTCQPSSGAPSSVCVSGSSAG